MEDILGYEDFLKIEPINKGWSSDRKYYIETADGERLLLRVANVSEHDRKKAEYGALSKASALDIYAPQPRGFGLCENGKSVYYLVTWLEGEDAASAMETMTDTEKYVLGLRAGELLRKLHTLPAPDDSEPWQVRFQRKIDERLADYHHNKGRTENGELVIKYLADNADLLSKRAQTFNHGDFNTTNLIVSPSGEVGAIDFNCFNDNRDYGDPLWEMICISYSETPDAHYYTGMWNGYAGGKPDDEFFRMTAYYFAYDVIASLGGDENFDNGDFDNKALAWYDNFKSTVPSWYLKDFYIQWTDAVPYMLKSPFDFSFLRKYGKVFKVFDGQDSGNICFGMQDGDRKYFVKFAGAPTAEYKADTEGAVERLKSAVSIYEDLAHPHLIRYISSEEIGGGFAVVFDWVDAVCPHRMYPADHKKFKEVSLESRMQIFEDVLEFHEFVVQKGYIQVDFYDGSIMWDFGNEKTVICDIDFYSKRPMDGSEVLWGCSRFAAPEERKSGEPRNEVTNVYNMGATAFCLFCDSKRELANWPLSEALYAVAKKAVSVERGKRQQSIRQLIDEWDAAKEIL